MSRAQLDEQVLTALHEERLWDGVSWCRRRETVK